MTTSSEKVNSTTYIYHLRQGVKFHDGTPFNASAVKYSFDRAIRIGRGHTYALTPYLKSVDIIDDYTVIYIKETY